MPDVLAQKPRDNGADNAASRRRSRQERQARVGLLRNPNQPPRPAARSAQLMGRWLNLRSSRRAAPARADAVDPAVTAPPTEPVAWDEQGQVAAINISGLMASVRDLGTDRSVRASFAAPYRADAATDDDIPPMHHDLAALSAHAWLDEIEPETAPPPPRRRNLWWMHGLRGVGYVLAGLALAVFVLALLPIG